MSIQSAISKFSAAKARRSFAPCVAVLLFVASLGLFYGPAYAAAQSQPTRFSVTDSGTAGKPDILLIPGLASSRAVWDGEAKLLAPNYRLHIVQVDGFAGVPAGPNATGPMFPAIVDELHGYIATQKLHPVVIGHSLGGLLALMLADKYPTDVAKLVIVDALPFYGLLLDPQATAASIAPQAKVFHDQTLAMPAEQFATLEPMLVKQMVKDDGGAKAVAASTLASDRTVVANAIFEDLQTDLRGDLARIKTPTLLLYPFDPALDHDAAAKDALYKGAYAAMPNVKLVRIDDSRHFIMYDQPAKMDAAIEAFLKEPGK